MFINEYDADGLIYRVLLGEYVMAYVRRSRRLCSQEPTLMFGNIVDYAVKYFRE